jgi:hypothetical protein
MPRILTPTAFTLIPVSVLALLTSPGSAAPKPDYTEVELRTGDGAELVGRYWPGRLGRKSPAVILLDDVGPGSDQARCAATARELARDGCAVLWFDFRGHGRSTRVAPEFWADPTNRRLVRGYSAARPKATIAATDFRAGYLPHLVNDISAARAYLLRRNDAGECNAGQTIVVGFGRGAALGALWVAAEWGRYRVIGEFPQRLRDAPEGKDVIGCVWVSPDPKLDGRTRPMLDWIARAERDRSVVQAWIYDQDDAGAAALARRCAAKWNRGADKLSVARTMAADGGRPITDDPALPENIGRGVKFIREAAESIEWDDRDFTDGRFVWAFPGRRTAVAKAADQQWFSPAALDALLGQ